MFCWSLASWMFAGCRLCYVCAHSTHAAQLVQCLSQNIRLMKHTHGEAEGQLGSWGAGLDVWCSSNRQEVGLRARLDGEQLSVRGHTQCVSCVQAGHGPSSTARFLEIPRKPHNPSGWYFYMEKEECAFEKMVRWQAYSWERELLNHS